MIIVNGASGLIRERLNTWYRDQLGEDITPYATVLGILDNYSNIKGVFFFEDYNGSNIEIHAQAPGCLNKLIIKLILNYVFNQLNCNRLTIKPYRKEKKLIKAMLKIGFKYEAILKSYYGLTKGDDAVVYVMHRADATKWIG